MGKLDGVCMCMDALDADHVASVALDTRSLEETHKALMQYPGMGPFMAYEVVTDLAHTPVLRRARDRMTWANPGPGCLRGLGHVYGTRHTRANPATLLHMRELLDLAGPDSFYWPEDWPAWDMRTVEHWLCEYDKYCRGVAGTRLKRRYRA